MLEDRNVISLDKARAMQPSIAGTKSITLRLTGQTLEYFQEVERALDNPGAMAYFRDGLWLAAFAMSRDSQGGEVKLWVEYVDENKKTVKENLLAGFKLHSLRRRAEKIFGSKKPNAPVPLHDGSLKQKRRRAR